jgi:hypothetical protein
LNSRGKGKKLWGNKFASGYQKIKEFLCGNMLLLLLLLLLTMMTMTRLPDSITSNFHRINHSPTCSSSRGGGRSYLNSFVHDGWEVGTKLSGTGQHLNYQRAPNHPASSSCHLRIPSFSNFQNSNTSYLRPVSPRVNVPSSLRLRPNSRNMTSPISLKQQQQQQHFAAGSRSLAKSSGISCRMHPKSSLYARS